MKTTTYKVGMRVRIRGPEKWAGMIGVIESKEDRYSDYDWYVMVSGCGGVPLFESEIEPASEDSCAKS